LSDRQAADAVRARIDWKYALSLELDDSGFDFSVLSEFRSRLVAGHAEQLLFETMLTRFKEKKLVRAGGNVRSDSTHVLAKIRALNRVECVHETLRAALNSLAVVVPEWLKAWTELGKWHRCYDKRLSEERLPKEQADREILAKSMGRDGFSLWEAIYSNQERAWLVHLPALKTLRQVWLQQFQIVEGVVEWRANDNTPPALFFIV
jgi:transposase